MKLPVATGCLQVTILVRRLMVAENLHMQQHHLVFAFALQDDTDVLIPLEDVLPACMAEFVVPPPDAGHAWGVCHTQRGACKSA